jgi:hypothetical protein
MKTCICETHLKTDPDSGPCLNGKNHRKDCPCKLYQEEKLKHPRKRFTYYPSGTFPKKKV